MCLCYISNETITATNKSQPTSASENRKINEQGISHDKRIVCYLGSWSVESTGMNVEMDIDPYICTHIIYAFASFDENGAIVDGEFGKFDHVCPQTIFYK